MGVNRLAVLSCLLCLSIDVVRYVITLGPHRQTYRYDRVVLYAYGTSLSNGTAEASSPRRAHCLPLYDVAREVSGEGGDDQADGRGVGVSGSQTYPVRRTGQMVACFEHDKRTCCSRERSGLLWERLKSFISPTINMSPKCKDAFRSVVCSECDGDMGVGMHLTVKGEPLFCPRLCDSWYEACRYDYFAPHPPLDPFTSHSNVKSDKREVGRHRPFPLKYDFSPCLPNSLLCAQLTQFVVDGSDLCRRVGAAVPVGLPLMTERAMGATSDDDDEDEEDEHLRWYEKSERKRREIEEMMAEWREAIEVMKEGQLDVKCFDALGPPPASHRFPSYSSRHSTSPHPLDDLFLTTKRSVYALIAYLAKLSRLAPWLPRWARSVRWGRSVLSSSWVKALMSFATPPIFNWL